MDKYTEYSGARRQGNSFKDIIESEFVGQGKNDKYTANFKEINNRRKKSDSGANSIICKPLRVGTVIHGGSTSFDSKQWRVYSIHAKSATLCGQGGGAGAKTELYKIGLSDGSYIIRKLTPVEAERLQTLPENYTEGISNTQRYKCLGNGWTIDVIVHILKQMPLCRQLLGIYCPSDGVVYDPFMGSGTTAAACKGLGIKYIGSELSKKQCEWAENRLNNMTADRTAV